MSAFPAFPSPSAAAYGAANPARASEAGISSADKAGNPARTTRPTAIPSGCPFRISDRPKADLKAAVGARPVSVDPPPPPPAAEGGSGSGRCRMGLASGLSATTQLPVPASRAKLGTSSACQLRGIEASASRWIRQVRACRISRPFRTGSRRQCRLGSADEWRDSARSFAAKGGPATTVEASALQGS